MIFRIPSQALAKALRCSHRFLLQKYHPPICPTHPQSSTLCISSRLAPINLSHTAFFSHRNMSEL